MDKTKNSSIRILNYLLITILALGTLIVLLFSFSLKGNATIYLWMLACLLTGTAIGFLFGIPKILQNSQLAGANTASPTYQQQVNTNLTEISDWLTKIIVGLGLVSLTKIPPYISTVSNILANALSLPGTTPSPLAFAFACGTIVSYLILGFLFGYINTRLYLAGAFSEADQKALNIAKEASGAAQSALQKAEFAIAKPSSLQTHAGQTPDKEMEQLSQTYNQIRGNMSPGHTRTQKMTEVIKQMMNVVPLLTSFNVSKSLQEVDNGKRLTGYAYLYVKPDYQLLSELVDAISSDPTPFGQYWGIQAIGKVIESNTNDKISSKIFKKLKSYYDKLEEGVDREYELAKLFPDLKK